MSIASSAVIAKVTGSVIPSPAAPAAASTSTMAWGP